MRSTLDEADSVRLRGGSGSSPLRSANWSVALLGAGLPPKVSPGLVKPEQDIYYAIFVALVLVAGVIGAIIAYRRMS